MDVLLPGQYWVKDIVISRPPHRTFFFLSAGGRPTPRSVLGEGYRNIPAPRRFFFFPRILYIRLELWPTEDAPGYTAHHPWANIPQGHYSRHFCYFCIYFVRIHRAPQSNGGRPWVVGWTLGTDPRGMSRAKCTAHRPWANIPQGHQFITVPFV